MSSFPEHIITNTHNNTHMVVCPVNIALTNQVVDKTYTSVNNCCKCCKLYDIKGRERVELICPFGYKYGYIFLQNTHMQTNCNSSCLHNMMSLSLVWLAIIACATVTDVSAKDTTSLYQITGSCKVVRTISNSNI